MQKVLILAGVALIAIGALWPYLGALGIGRLPGDIVIEKPGFRFYFPITTALIVSLIVSAIFWLFRK